MDRPRVATAVLLTRGEGDALELFLVLRAPELRFFGGYWAFPGGALDPLDGDEDDDEASDGARAAVRCGLRELFEETGVLPARIDGATSVPGCSRATPRRAASSAAGSTPRPRRSMPCPCSAR